LRDDPAAFREMVEAGVRALQEVTEAQGRTGKSVASAVSDARNDTSTGSAGASFVVAQHAAPLPGRITIACAGNFYLRGMAEASSRCSRIGKVLESSVST
jgi:hypothetical protein